MRTTITTAAAPGGTAPRRHTILERLLIWNAAWREHARLQRLDPDELRDMGLTEADRATVTVRQIAARMLG